MIIFKSINKLNKEVNFKANIGFVPTMGALHKGHISLIKSSKLKCKKTLVSIFINPSQFNQINDFKKYPRKLSRDIEILKKLKVDYLLIPKKNEIYKNKKNMKINIRKKDKILCAKFRPGHFEGVLAVIKAWDPKAQHEKMIKLYNYKTTAFNRTFEKYDHTNCNLYMNVHDYIKLCKHGYSKVTDHATREIRHKRLDRNSAIKLVKKYESAKVKYESLFNEWIGVKDINKEFFYDKLKNNKYWIRKDVKKYVFNGHSKNLKKQKKLKISLKINYKNNSNLNLNKKPSLITFGKGI